MPALLVSALKWIATTVLIPMIQKWVEQYMKAKKRATKLKEKIKGNQAKTEVYEKDSSDSNFSDLP